jgi:hypothetical protein
VKDWMDTSNGWTTLPSHPLDQGPRMPNLGREIIPAVDFLMKPDVLPPPLWDPSAPVMPIVPVPKSYDPFGPVPRPPIEVDPPSRPPQWMFGPPEIAERAPRSPFETLFAANSGRALQEGTPFSRHLGEARPAPPPPLIAPAMRSGSLADLLMDYIRRQKEERAVDANRR